MDTAIISYHAFEAYAAVTPYLVAMTQDVSTIYAFLIQYGAPEGWLL